VMRNKKDASLCSACQPHKPDEKEAEWHGKKIFLSAQDSTCTPPKA